MKLPYSWLKEYVNTKFSAEDIAEKLTMAGLEVEEVISGMNCSGVIVGKVISLEKHPNADKLRVAMVDVGPEVLQIVCGAANLEKGQIVPVAVVGAKLADFEIGKATLRGVDSYGMICSEKELGPGDDHSGILVLTKAHKIGEVFVSDKGSDQVIDVNILANRPDCMSIIGLAREVSAITGEKLSLRDPKFSDTKSPSPVRVTVSDSNLCPRYLSRVISGVNLSETPTWMAQRLLASGIRSIDLLVDISNYVMLEYGQPLHFFDLDKLADKVINVRPAKSGETIRTLDGNLRKLTPDNLVIANSQYPIAIAGVMGGEETEISKTTKNIFIEAAVFDKASIRRTSRTLGLRSEAVARYEKGLGLATPEQAIDRAAELLVELAGGTIASKREDTHAGNLKHKTVSLNPSKLNAFLGSNFSDALIRKTLTSLGFSVNIRTKYHFEIEAPFWRVDIDEAVDLYEEVARIVGFDQILSTLPYDVHTVSVPNQYFDFSRKLRHELAAIGLSEIMTYSFASDKELVVTGADPKEAFEVANPLVKEQKYMRVSLIPKLLESLASNQYLADNVSFFEFGKTFHRLPSVIPAKTRIQGKPQSLPLEKSLLSIGIIGGKTWPISYPEGSEYYQVKGALEHLFSFISVDKVEFVAKESSLYEGGRSAEILVGKEVLGEIGEIRSVVSRTVGLKKPVAVAILDLDVLMTLLPLEKVSSQISKYQHSQRDISFVIPSTVSIMQILDTLQGVDGLISSVEICDIYQGRSLDQGQKSVTVRLTIVSHDRTLTEDEVEKVVVICQNKVKKLGGIVRGLKA